MAYNKKWPPMLSSGSSRSTARFDTLLQDATLRDDRFTSVLPCVIFFLASHLLLQQLMTHMTFLRWVHELVQGVLGFCDNALCLGENPSAVPPGLFSTGCPRIDEALQEGGVRGGELLEITGPAGSGKTTLALQAVAAAQRDGMTCAWIDADCALHSAYALALGVQSSRLLMLRPESARQMIDMCEVLLASGGVALVVVDSITGLHSKAACRSLMAAARRGRAVLLCTQPDDLQQSTANLALARCASVRLQIRPLKLLRDAHQACGFTAVIEFLKTSALTPPGALHIQLTFGQGFAASAASEESAIGPALAAHTA